MKLQCCKLTYRSFFMVVILMCFAFAKAYSQRDRSKIQLQSDQINTVAIFLDQELELKIATHELPEIWFNESQGGEYKSAVVFKTKFNNNTITISDLISPDFHFPQDKLSAHKVLDNKAQITIPKGMKVTVHVRSSFLSISGDFKNLAINQQSGDSTIKEFTGDLKVVSVYANIHLHLKDYLMDVTSKEGRIEGVISPDFYRYKAQVETIYGNVTVTD